MDGSREDALRRRQERKENVVPVKLLSKERLVFLDGHCVIGKGKATPGHGNRGRKGSTRSASETSEQREARLSRRLLRARERARQRLATETAEEREARHSRSRVRAEATYQTR